MPNWFFFFFQAEDGIRDLTVTGVQTCALPILPFEDLVQGDDGNQVLGDGSASGPELVREGRIGCRQVALLKTFEEAHLAGGVAHRYVKIDVPRTVSLERLELGTKRLDIHPVPATLVEMLRDRVHVRVPGAHIDIEAGRLLVKQTIQHHVFEVLGVRVHSSLMEIGLLEVADIVRCARPLRSVFACVRETRAGPRASIPPPDGRAARLTTSRTPRSPRRA